MKNILIQINCILALSDLIKMVATKEKLADQILVTLGMYTKLPVNEAAPLRFSDFDFENGTVTISRHTVRYKSCGCIIEPLPQKKVIDIPKELIRTLKLHKSELDEKYSDCKCEERTDYIFPSTAHYPVVPETLSLRVRRISDKYGLPWITYGRLTHLINNKF
jgi:integrase